MNWRSVDLSGGYEFEKRFRQMGEILSDRENDVDLQRLDAVGLAEFDLEGMTTGCPTEPSTSPLVFATSSEGSR